LIPFAGGVDNIEELDLRTNHFQEVGSDGGPSRGTHIGPLTRAMTRRMEEEEEEEEVQKTLFLCSINF